MKRSTAAVQEARGGNGPRPSHPPGPAASAAVPLPSSATHGSALHSAAVRLRIGGFTPLTTVDYPGELAAVVFCQGCPWRCRYFHNAHLLLPHGEIAIAWDQVRSTLERRRGLLDAVVFSGGEPTLQSALPAAAAEIKAMGFKVGLHTAGCYPVRLRRLLPLLDWVGLDIKALPEDYAAITGVPGTGERAWRSLGMLLETDIALQVRTTVMPGWAERRIEALQRRLSAMGVRHQVLQPCRLETTLDPGLRTAARLTPDSPP